MKITNKKELPLVKLKTITDILAITREFASSNQHLVTYSENGDFICLFEDIDNKSDFHFLIREVRHYKALLPFFKHSNRAIEILTLSKPSDETKTESRNSSHFSKEALSNEISNWLQLLEAYNQYHLSEEEKLTRKGEKEIYDLFDFVDDNAETAAFDLKQQLYLDDALANIANTLEAQKDNYEVTEIIEEIKNLRGDLPITTKKSFGKKLSKLFVAVKKKGIPLFKEIIKDFFKDMAKKGIEGGFQRMIEFFQ